MIYVQMASATYRICIQGFKMILMKKRRRRKLINEQYEHLKVTAYSDIMTERIARKHKISFCYFGFSNVQRDIICPCKLAV